MSPSAILLPTTTFTASCSPWHLHLSPGFICTPTSAAPFLGTAVTPIIKETTQNPQLPHCCCTSSLLHPRHCGETLKYLFQKSWHRNRATRDVLELGDTVGDEKLMMMIVCWLQRMQTPGKRSRRQEQPCTGAGAMGHLHTRRCRNCE